MIRILQFVLLATILTSCASTTLYDPQTGRKVFSTQADAEQLGLTVAATGMTLTVARLIHSVPTEAGGRAFAKGVQSTGMLATEIATAVVMKGVVR